ncbi:hypothetical protein C9I50_05285 [Pseudomonas prosekii]|uniref:hypothetical protein n=1 Tax=Pseudomonas TaxID=286 RepID=UPI000D61044C|nr:MULTISPECIES: hypothetical protein [Pseudomonas]PWE44715.1 hypothetical protein C9I50_05285 [Pseudomonas prosekii]TWD44511.1 hypothetical protein FBY12_4799 [Pseudomonas sp. SJZ131]
MNKLIVAVVLLGLAGCTTNAKSHNVRGGNSLEIDCSGLGAGWDMCYERAASECKGKSYKVLARSSDLKADPEDSLFGWNPAGYLTRILWVGCVSG